MKTPALIALILIILAFTPLSLAVVQNITYPAPNDVISQRSRIPLTVTSTQNSSGCWFNYDQVRNVSVACNGATLVDLPNLNGDYVITVGDTNGTSVTQTVTVAKPEGLSVLLVYILTVFVLVLSPMLLVYNVARVTKHETNLYDVGVSWTVAFLFLIDYFLFVEIVNVPTMTGWLDLFLSVFGWSLIILPLLCFIVSMIFRGTKKKKPLGGD